MTDDPDAPICELATATGVELPAAYFAFLDGLPNRPVPLPGWSPSLRFGDAGWVPFDRGRLMKPVRIDRHPSVPAARQLAPIAAGLNHPDPAVRAELVEWLAADGFDPDRLGRGFCVGDNNNGDPVFVDPVDGGVYFYRHDGMSVERLAASLGELIAGSVDPPPDDE